MVSDFFRVSEGDIFEGVLYYILIFMTIQRFEDLDIWKNARLLCIRIRDLSVNSGLAKDYSLKDQIKRSSGSVMDNIAEGFERDVKKEFIQFLYIAKGSLGET